MEVRDQIAADGDVGQNDVTDSQLFGIAGHFGKPDEVANGRVPQTLHPQLGGCATHELVQNPDFDTAIRADSRAAALHRESAEGADVTHARQQVLFRITFTGVHENDVRTDALRQAWFAKDPAL